MSVTDDPRTLGRTRLSFASEADIDEFVATLEKFESGELTPDQWRMFRLVRGTYGQRQPGDVQMLRVKIPQGILSTEQLNVLADIAEDHSRGFGHITTCHFAGVAGDEVFDVTPYAEAMTRYLLRHRLSASLPRKFKIAFEGCAEDHALLPIHDIGWRAQVRVVDGRPRRGFRVVIGGGTAILCTSAWPLFEFLPASEIFNAAEAVVRVFHRF